MVKFGKDLQDECLDKWKDHYLNYKELKSTIRNELLVADSDSDIDNISQLFNNFDSLLEEELTKINSFYKENIGLLSSELNDIVVTIDNTSKDDDKQKMIKNLTVFYNKVDELRHYILLNVIAVIKIIKKRNKKAFPYHEKITQTDHSTVLESQPFYNSEELLSIFDNLKEKSISFDTLRLENVFKKCEGFLVNFQEKQQDFELGEILPGSSSKKWSSDEINDYLQTKLGITHQLEQITDLANVEERNAQIIERISKTGEQVDVQATNQLMMWRTFVILSSLYAFLFGLDMMGSAFKALSGKNIGELFQQINNPVAGLIVGILVTVMLQSSSTTTSIIVSMVGADLVNIQQAIPLIMGANIGTSVTNTIVSHGHVGNIDEFQKAFSGATIHDIFNLMCVCILLPFEIITGALGGPFLESVSDTITTSVFDLKGLKFKSPLKLIVAPLVKEFISIDKKIISANAKGCVSCELDRNTTTTTDIVNYDDDVVDITGCWNLDHDECYTLEKWNEKYENGAVIKSGIFSELGDAGGGVVALILSLGILCVALYKIVKTLHTIVLQGKGRGRILDLLVNTITKNGSLSILFGMLLTISVQSSSITTSTLTPLVGLSIISLEQMLPLTLGANLGTTCTAFMASLVTESKNSVQIAVCHFIFNVTGVTIFYPIQKVRRLPIEGAKRLGKLVTHYKWFSVFYTSYVFVIVPLILFGISFLFNGNVLPSILGTIFIGMLGYTSHMGLTRLEQLQSKKIESNINRIIVE